VTANAKVEQRHRDMVEAWCRERGWLCPPEGAEQLAANAEQRGREDEREECAVLVSRYDGEGWLDRDVWNEWRTANGDVFAPVAAAIRARGQRKDASR